MAYLNRSKAALRTTVETFFAKAAAGEHQAFLWTFTLRKAVDVAAAFTAWNRFAKALWNYGKHPETGERTINGVRVAEMHPGGHGVHFHVLLNRRLPIQAVRRIAEKYGFFWIDVRRAFAGKGALGAYLGKYLTKEDRAPCLKGRRLWSAIGQWGQTKCKDVVIDTEFCAYFKKRREMLAAAAKIHEAMRHEYRIEHSLETMEWAKDHVRKVALGLRLPLRPDLWYDSDPPDPPKKGFEDWEAAFWELAHARN